MPSLPSAPFTDIDSARVAVDAPVSTDLMTDIVVDLNFFAKGPMGKRVAGFTSSGSFTPPADCSYIFCEVIGGGGGGGGSKETNDHGAGGGGASGVFQSGTIQCTPGVPITITVGAGGAGGAGGVAGPSNGADGGASTVAGVTTLSAAGGGGGVAGGVGSVGTNGTGGVGAAATNNAVAFGIDGTPGGDGINCGSGYNGGGFGALPPSYQHGSRTLSTFLTLQFVPVSDASAGPKYGGGGGGGTYYGGHGTGGNGAPGLVVLRY